MHSTVLYCAIIIVLILIHVMLFLVVNGCMVDQCSTECDKTTNPVFCSPLSMNFVVQNYNVMQVGEKDDNLS